MGQDINSYKMEEMLADLKEKMAESKKLPPEEQKKYWERLADEEARKYPENPLGPCKDKNRTCRDITLAFGYMSELGYGDLQELCDLTAFHEALEAMDLEDCRKIIGPPRGKEPFSYFINRCLFYNIEKVVQGRLINDNFDEEQAKDTYMYGGDRGPISPLDFEWRGPLAEEADKRFKEEL